MHLLVTQLLSVSEEKFSLVSAQVNSRQFLDAKLQDSFNNQPTKPTLHLLAKKWYFQKWQIFLLLPLALGLQTWLNKTIIYKIHVLWTASAFSEEIFHNVDQPLFLRIRTMFQRHQYYLRTNENFRISNSIPGKWIRICLIRARGELYRHLEMHEGCYASYSVMFAFQKWGPKFDLYSPG